MIGLGSNRLTVCRRGGMSVTQAGRGGMEWLAGGRMPSWASPYSAQATAALKAQFPTQWQTIRDYGFAHPEIVGYMNAYAPEDAKIAYSLVEGIGTRWLDNGGNSYINTKYLRTHNTKITLDLIAKASGDTAFMGTRGSAYLFYNFGSNYFWPISRCDSITGTLVVGNVYHLEWDGDNFVVTGTDGVRQTAARNIGAQSGEMYIFNFNPIDGRWANAKIRYLKIEESGVEQKYLVPFIRTGGICCMLDLLATGTDRQLYYDAQGSGSFTISETPAS